MIKTSSLKSIQSLEHLNHAPLSISNTTEQLKVGINQLHSQKFEGKPSVLITDDQEDMLIYIASLLNNPKQKFNVELARSANEALQKINDGYLPDLVIADWMMPEIDGLTFIKKLQENSSTSSIPTILLSAKADTESRLQGTDSGVSAYLGKPFDERELLSMVTNLLKLKEREREVEKLNQDITEKLLKRYLPPMLVNDFMHDGHTESRATTTVFGGKKWIKYALQCFLRHSDAGVFDANLQVSRTVIGVSQRYINFTSLWHRIPCVEDKIHHRLLQLSLIDFAVRRFNKNLELNLIGSRH